MNLADHLLEITKRKQQVSNEHNQELTNALKIGKIRKDQDIDWCYLFT